MENNSPYEIIKTRNIFLKEGEKSSEIVLVDSEGEGDMYFTFTLKYLQTDVRQTHLMITDAFHANIIIETTPNSLTTLGKPYVVGSYASNKELLIDFIVQPSDANKLHSVTITFYVNKKQ